jgi:hypothetical protein
MEEEEGQEAKGKSSPANPSKEEVEKHMLTHVPFRSWCKHCVAGKATMQRHHRVEKRRGIPVIGIDYAHMGIGGDEGGQGMPIIVMHDKDSGFITANVVQEKGPNGHAIKRVCQDIGMI